MAQTQDDVDRLSRALDDVRALRAWHARAVEDARAADEAHARSASIALEAVRHELRMAEGRLALEREAVQRHPTLGARSWGSH